MTYNLAFARVITTQIGVVRSGVKSQALNSSGGILKGRPVRLVPLVHLSRARYPLWVVMLSRFLPRVGPGLFIADDGRG